MNFKEHLLEEVELSDGHVREALQSLLHTILFARAPGPVRPQEADCDAFGMSYAKCGRDVDKTVDDAIRKFRESLVQVAPELLRGQVVVSFFQRRVKNTMFFGMVSNEEKVVWEQWILPVLVNVIPPAAGTDSASELERQRLQATAEETVQLRLLQILTRVNGDIDHIPPVMYEFDIKCPPVTERREGVYSRLMQAPSLINLSS